MSDSIRAVLCDLDDTVYQETTFVASGFRAVATNLSTRFGIDRAVLLNAMMEILVEQGRGKVFDQLLERYLLRARVRVSELITIYRSHKPQIALYPGVTQTFAALRAIGIKIGIVTDGMLAVQQNKISALGLDQTMDTIVYTDEIGPDYWKPHPAAFERALEILAVPAADAVYIGNDPTKDFPGPNSLGMLTVHLFPEPGLAHHSCAARVHVEGLAGILELVSQGSAA